MIVARDGSKYGIYDTNDGLKLNATYSNVGCDPQEIYANLPVSDEESDIEKIDNAEKVLLIDI